MSKGAVIIGNGIAGISAARTIRKQSSIPITVISSETAYFYSRTALMYWFMGHLQWEQLEPYERNFWRKNNIELIQSKVERVVTAQKCIQLANSKEIPYDYLVVATGSKVKRPEWWTDGIEGVSGLYSKQDVEYIAQWVKSIQYGKPKISKATIVGGGLIGVELAEMLHAEGIEVTVLIKESSYWRSQLPSLESTIVTQHILSKGIQVIADVQVSQLIVKNGVIGGVVLQDGSSIATDFLGVTIGVQPNTDLIFDVQPAIDRGYLVDRFLKTSLIDIYAVGDCVQLQQPPQGRKSQEPVWYTARLMGETAGNSIVGKLTEYDPGIWFNSAKFFDLEYQVYGSVNDEMSCILWNEGERVVRAVFNEREQLVGVLGLGFRLRQEVATKWITEGFTKEHFRGNFKQLSFEPEFQFRYEKMVWKEYNTIHT